MCQCVGRERLEEFKRMLALEERSAGTIEKYLRDAGGFLTWLDGRTVTKELVVAWKGHMLESRKPVTVNAMLAAVNRFLGFLGMSECRVRALKIQREAFRGRERDLKMGDYDRLMAAAERLGRKRTMLLLETLGSTGIRVSELRCITVEAAKAGTATIRSKGKVRDVLIPRKLGKKLVKYAKAQGIQSGDIFVTRTGRPLGRKQIWAELKALCAEAGVEPSKVYPHNLRHLFARRFYQATKDVVKLADVLGHSSVNTTRIYLIATGEEHRRQIEGLGMVS